MRPSKPPSALSIAPANAPIHPLPAGMRDLLPPEAQKRRKLSRRLLEHFGLHGYALVTPPAFELADVLERGLGTLDPSRRPPFRRAGVGRGRSASSRRHPANRAHGGDASRRSADAHATLLRRDRAAQAPRARAQAPSNPASGRRAARRERSRGRHRAHGSGGELGARRGAHRVQARSRSRRHRARHDQRIPGPASAAHPRCSRA